LDENEIGVLFEANNGRVHDVRAMSDGFAGELYSEDGWIAKFSKYNEEAPIENLS